MERLKVGAVGLALVFAVCSAFTNARTVKADETSYGVTQENATTYTVTNLTGQTPGQDFRCIANPDEACTVTADSSDVSNGTVQKTDATIEESGQFQNL